MKRSYWFSFTIYDPFNRFNKYLCEENETPTLMRGKDYTSLEELWLDYNKELIQYNIKYFKEHEQAILDIVNYKHTNPNNSYLLCAEECMAIINGYYKDNEGLHHITNILDYVLYDIANAGKYLLLFLEIYYRKLIYKLYNETPGGNGNDHDELSTDLYLDWLVECYQKIRKAKYPYFYIMV